MKTSTTIQELPESKLVKQQTKKYGPTFYIENDKQYRITVTVRYDDQCGNGHNSFGITAEIDEWCGYWTNDCGGCCHEHVAKHFPELTPLIKWHLTSTDGPMHYLQNAKYWAGHSGYREGKPNNPPNLEHLKSTIVYGALPEDENFVLDDCIYSDARGFTWNEAKCNELADWLVNRLPALMLEFKKAVESIGFTY
jgi:hypothetical protein